MGTSQAPLQNHCFGIILFSILISESIVLILFLGILESTIFLFLIASRLIIIMIKYNYEHIVKTIKMSIFISYKLIGSSEIVPAMLDHFKKLRQNNHQVKE